MILFATVLVMSMPGPAEASAARDAWTSCLMDFAQSESAGTKTAVTITIQALASCQVERSRYVAQLARTDVDTKTLNDQIAADDLDVARRLIAFINRSR